LIAGPYDYIDSFSAIKNKVMNEVIRQVIQM
jgi:hypothetical protein